MKNSILSGSTEFDFERCLFFLLHSLSLTVCVDEQIRIRTGKG